jgi:hypothetical protein
MEKAYQRERLNCGSFVGRACIFARREYMVENRFPLVAFARTYP